MTTAAAERPPVRMAPIRKTDCNVPNLGLMPRPQSVPYPAHRPSLDETLSDQDLPTPTMAQDFTPDLYIGEEHHEEIEQGEHDDDLAETPFSLPAHYAAPAEEQHEEETVSDKGDEAEHHHEEEQEEGHLHQPAEEEEEPLPLEETSKEGLFNLYDDGPHEMMEEVDRDHDENHHEEEEEEAYEEDTSFEDHPDMASYMEELDPSQGPAKRFKGDHSVMDHMEGMHDACGRCTMHEGRINVLESALADYSTQLVQLFNQHNLLKKFVLQNHAHLNSMQQAFTHLRAQQGGRPRPPPSAHPLANAHRAVAKPRPAYNGPQPYAPTQRLPAPTAHAATKVMPSSAPKQQFQTIQYYHPTASANSLTPMKILSSPSNPISASRKRTIEAALDPPEDYNVLKRDGEALKRTRMPDYPELERSFLDLMAYRAKQHINLGVKHFHANTSLQKVLTNESEELDTFRDRTGLTEDADWEELKQVIDKRLITRLRKMNAQFQLEHNTHRASKSSVPPAKSAPKVLQPPPEPTFHPPGRPAYRSDAPSAGHRPSQPTMPMQRPKTIVHPFPSQPVAPHPRMATKAPSARPPQQRVQHGFPPNIRTLAKPADVGQPSPQQMVMMMASRPGGPQNQNQAPNAMPRIGVTPLDLSRQMKNGTPS